MKSFGFLFILCLVLISCEDNNPLQPASENLVPIRFEQAGFVKELNYNESGNLSEVVSTYVYPNGVKSTSSQLFHYNEEGRLTRSTTSTGWRLEYTYDENNHLVKTDEYVNDVWSQLHTFLYNDKGLVIEAKKFQNIPDEGGIIPVSKDVYGYDGDDNLILMELYYYTSYGIEAKLLTIFSYSDYDKKRNSESYFNVHPFNPTLKLHNNNPGKMTVENANGIISSTDVYKYTYNRQGYATEKTVTTTLYHGEKEMYISKYFFRE